MLCLNKSTVARTISYLEEKGYLTRKQDLNDKRQFSVFPTDKMLDVFSEVMEISAKWNELISSDIRDEELAVFFSVLSKIEANATDVIKRGEFE
jgi:DNA-binding MarR family transcriptional regulator